MIVLQACAPQTPTPVTQPPPTAGVEATVSETEVPVEDTASRLERLGGYPCPDSDFTCIDVSVPLNHFDPQDARTTDVVFAVLPATGERKGMFVTVIGGPGGSGLMSADNYTSYFDPAIPENFDIVFFDQRGINMSGGLYCIDAAAKYYRSDTDATTPEGEAPFGTGWGEPFDGAQGRELAERVPVVKESRRDASLKARKLGGYEAKRLGGVNAGTPKRF